MTLETTERSRTEDTVAQAEAAAHSTLKRLRAQADEVVERMKPRIDAVTTYVRDEPTKSMLASAAVGAGVMALLVLVTRSNSRSPLVRSGTLQSLRNAALDLADRAHLAANHSLGLARKRSHGLFADVEKRADRALAAAQAHADQAHVRARARADEAAGAAQGLGDDAIDAARHKAAEFGDAATTTLTDAWKSIREQADPYVERMRPQLEAAARYAREDPTRAALGIATAGAIIVGLLALARSADRD